MINGVIECCKLENIQNINQEEKDILNILILEYNKYDNKEENKDENNNSY